MTLRSHRIGRAALYAGLVAAITTTARAGTTISFDSVPGQAASPGLLVTDQYESKDGVTFALGDGSSPMLAESGSTSPPAFVAGVDRTPNTVNPSAKGSLFFLTGNAMSGDGSHTLVMHFDTPVSAVSGDILDIDHSDAWAVLGQNAQGQVISHEMLAAGMPGTGDGVATSFGLNSPQDDIASVTLMYIGRGQNPGYGWSNFAFSGGGLQVGAEARTVPLPMAVFPGAIVIGSLLALRAMRKRNINARATT